MQARLDEVQSLADFVETTVQRLSRDASLKLRLMVEELFVNTICHGHGGDSDAPVEVTIRLGDDTVDVTYVDAAPAFDPFVEVERPEADAGVGERPVGRLGVYLITRLADRYGYAREANGNRVTLHVKVPPPGAGPGPSG